MFKTKGISRSRLTLKWYSPHTELLALYNDIDIALDSFPYSGGLTTCEALWMSVPMLTVPGETFANRDSVSHLLTIGLPELVECDYDDYVELAVGLANDIDSLPQWRPRQSATEKYLLKIFLHSCERYGVTSIYRKVAWIMCICSCRD